MINNQKVSNSLELDGYVVIPNFYSSDLAEKLVDIKDRVVCADIGRTESDEIFAKRSKSTCQTYMGLDSQFEEIAKLVDDMTGVAVNLSSNNTFYFSMLQYSPKLSCRGIGWHQDIDPETKNESESVYNFLIYPQSVPSDTPLKVVPKTHLATQSLINAPIENIERDAIDIFPRSGDLLIINSSIFHCVPENRNATFDRYSICVRFGPNYLKDKLNIGVYPTGKFDYSIGEFV